MVRDGIYYALGMLVVAGFLWWMTRAPAYAALPLALACFFLWFFRDPERVVPDGPGLIVSPADGKVTDVSATQLEGRPYTRVSIFLNVFDVHVNRSPIAGVVRDVTYRRGQFANAMDQASADLNEQNVVTVEGEGQTLVFKQIAGLLARRIVFDRKAGDRVARGERVGLIKFGSRTDVIFPATAQMNVKVGDRVKGGSSVLARTPVSQPVSAREPEHSGAVQ
ncbi:MAG TPA: phosphatidylserine decarboxylase [Candidatus Saccharimonadales bacterium]|jgi:phosphatidylserine decarboxylase|nr:phosphatidylserine decarboxylase [Candidatus Saccharimonadales bacterium]